VLSAHQTHAHKFKSHTLDHGLDNLSESSVYRGFCDKIVHAFLSRFL